jgi:hypothetical protein
MANTRNTANAQNMAHEWICGVYKRVCGSHNWVRRPYAWICGVYDWVCMPHARVRGPHERVCGPYTWICGVYATIYMVLEAVYEALVAHGRHRQNLCGPVPGGGAGPELIMHPLESLGKPVKTKSPSRKPGRAFWHPIATVSAAAISSRCGARRWPRPASLRAGTGQWPARPAAAAGGRHRGWRGPAPGGRSGRAGLLWPGPPRAAPP